MAEIRLGDHKKVEVLKVTIGEETYSVPLAGSLSVKKALHLDKQEQVIAFFQDHIPKKTLENLTVDELNYLIVTWKNESEKAGTISLGES